MGVFVKERAVVIKGGRGEEGRGVLQRGAFTFCYLFTFFSFHTTSGNVQGHLVQAIGGFINVRSDAALL